MGSLSCSTEIKHQILFCTRYVHLAQMNDLEQEDPVTWHALKNGEAKLEVPFTKLFVCQTLEQEIKMLK